MKILPSNIGRFLQLARKMWSSNYEDDSQLVVLTFTESCCSIAMATDGLLMSYLCNRVDTETNEQVIAAPFDLLQDCSNGSGSVDMKKVVKNRESHIEVEWSEGLVRCERTYPTHDPPKYHLLPNLAWHTVDERMVRMLPGTETKTNGGEIATNH